MIEQITYWCVTHRSPGEWEMNGGNGQVLRCWWDQLAGFRPGRGACKWVKATVAPGVSIRPVA